MHNERTYPNLLRLFGELGVATQPTEMSMSITCEGCGLEYAGARGLSGLFAQPRRAGNPAYLRMLGEVKRFHAHARRLIEHADDGARGTTSTASPWARSSRSAGTPATSSSTS